MALTIGDRNRKLWAAIKKGDISVSDLISDGGYLPIEQEMRFMQKVYASTPLLNSIRRVEMTAPKRRINKIGITGNFLNVAPSSGEALAADKRSKVFTEYVEMTTTELIGSMYIPYDVIEDNLERATLEDTIMDQILPQKVGRDLEKVVFQGDTASADNLLKAFNGVLKLMSADADSAKVTFNQVTGQPSTDMLETILEALPWQHRELHQALRYMVNYATVDKFVVKWIDRLTPGGDKMIDTDHLAQMGFRGIPFMPAAQMPATKAILTVPQNIILGVQRGIQYETARDIEARMIIIVVTLRAAVAVEQPDALVYVDGVNITGTTTT